MLVLSRQLDERILITTPSGERIIVEVVRISYRKVRLGITSGKGTIIHREEVQREIDAEKKLEGAIK